MHPCLRSGRLATLTTMFALAAGCMYGPGAPPSRGTPSRAPFDPTATTGVTDGRVTAQYLEGDLHEVANVSSDIVEAQGQASSIQFDAVNASPSWWLMTRLTFDPPLSDARWAPGTTVTTEGSAVTGAGLRVHAMGCSGPTRGRYTYDGGANRVTVHVEPGSTPDARQVSFTVYWDNAGGRPGALSGSFEYAPN